MLSAEVDTNPDSPASTFPVYHHSLLCGLSLKSQGLSGWWSYQYSRDRVQSFDLPGFQRAGSGQGCYPHIYVSTTLQVQPNQGHSTCSHRTVQRPGTSLAQLTRVPSGRFFHLWQPFRVVTCCDLPGASCLKLSCRLLGNGSFLPGETGTALYFIIE